MQFMHAKFIFKHYSFVFRKRNIYKLDLGLTFTTRNCILLTEKLTVSVNEPLYCTKVLFFYLRLKYMILESPPNTL